MPMTQQQLSELAARNEFAIGNLSYANLVAATPGYTTEQRNALLSEGGPVGAQIDYNPQQGAPRTPRTLAEILEMYRRGQLTNQDFYDALRNIGYSAESAKQTMQQEISTKASTGPTAVPTSVPLPPELSRYQDFLAQSEGGRRGLFGAAIRGQNPTNNPFQSYQLSRFEPTQAQYTIESGLAADAPGSFGEFASGRGSQPLDPEVWRAYLSSASSLLSNPVSNVPQRQGDFLQYLNDPEEGQGRQFDLALQSYLPNVAAPFRSSVRGGARDVFNDFLVNRPNNAFLPYFVGRGQRFF